MLKKYYKKLKRYIIKIKDIIKYKIKIFIKCILLYIYLFLIF